MLKLPFEVGSAVTNMAKDRALLELMPVIDSVVFRNYGWSQPYVSFGYSQHFQDVKNTVAVSDDLLIRRPTGGGIVDHNNDWTYTLLLPSNLDLFHKPRDLYELSHRLIQESLAQLEVKGLGLAPCPRACGVVVERPTVSQCFIQPELNDVMLGEKDKIAGAAIKKSKNGVLLQGSIAKNKLDSVNWNDFEKLFVVSLGDYFQTQIKEFDWNLIEGIENEVTRWAKEYSKPEWNLCR
jgi:lipoate-protein ligase A